MTHPLSNPNRELGVWNDIVLTDSRTQKGLLVTAIMEALRNDGLYSEREFTRVEQIVSDKQWSLDKDALLREARSGQSSTCFDDAVPGNLRGYNVVRADEIRWRKKSPKDLVRAIVVGAIRTDLRGVLDEEANETTGADTISLIVVHRATSALPTFQLLHDAIVAQQKKLHLAPVRVLVHDTRGREWL